MGAVDVGASCARRVDSRYRSIAHVGAPLAVDADLADEFILKGIERSESRPVSDAIHRVALEELARDAVTRRDQPLQLEVRRERRRGTAHDLADGFPATEHVGAPSPKITPSARSGTIPSTSPALTAGIWALTIASADTDPDDIRRAHPYGDLRSRCISEARRFQANLSSPSFGRLRRQRRESLPSGRAVILPALCTSTTSTSGWRGFTVRRLVLPTRRSESFTVIGPDRPPVEGGRRRRSSRSSLSRSSTSERAAERPAGTAHFWFHEPPAVRGLGSARSEAPPPGLRPAEAKVPQPQFDGGEGGQWRWRPAIADRTGAKAIVRLGAAT